MTLKDKLKRLGEEEKAYRTNQEQRFADLHRQENEFVQQARDKIALILRVCQAACADAEASGLAAYADFGHKSASPASLGAADQAEYVRLYLGSIKTKDSTDCAHCAFDSRANGIRFGIGPGKAIGVREFVEGKEGHEVGMPLASIDKSRIEALLEDYADRAIRVR